MASSQRERAVRSDSLRNRDAILDAAVACLAERPTASIADIATAAGVGRVTLYGHFASRDALLAAVLHRTMAEVEEAMSAVDLSGEPWEALDGLVRSSWQVLSGLNSLLGSMEQSLPRDAVRAAHEAPLTRVRGIIERGRSADAFRRDQSVEWQIASFFSLLHGAAAEVRAGRLAEADAGALLVETVRALLTPPGPAARPTR